MEFTIFLPAFRNATYFWGPANMQSFTRLFLIISYRHNLNSSNNLVLKILSISYSVFYIKTLVKEKTQFVIHLAYHYSAIYFTCEILRSYLVPEKHEFMRFPLWYMKIPKIIDQFPIKYTTKTSMWLGKISIFKLCLLVMFTYSKNFLYTYFNISPLQMSLKLLCFSTHLLTYLILYLVFYFIFSDHGAGAEEWFLDLYFYSINSHHTVCLCAFSTKKIIYALPL